MTPMHPLQGPGGRPCFSLSSEDCELLVAFAGASSLSKLAERMKRDPSSVSRQLSRLAADHPVLEKRQGRWTLTSQGEAVVTWALEAMATQAKLFESKKRLRLVTTREFGARVLAPQLGKLFPSEALHLSLACSEEGVEADLLHGKADLGFDCGRPSDPSIRFRAVSKERFSIVCSPQVARRLGRAANTRDAILSLPHLDYVRARAASVLALSAEPQNVVASFNDIAATRAACEGGMGWAVLPTYAVREELARGTLVELVGPAPRTETFGVWWLADRRDLLPWVKQAERWLRHQNLVDAVPGPNPRPSPPAGVKRGKTPLKPARSRRTVR